MACLCSQHAYKLQNLLTESLIYIYILYRWYTDINQCVVIDMATNKIQWITYPIESADISSYCNLLIIHQADNINVVHVCTADRDDNKSPSVWLYDTSILWIYEIFSMFYIKVPLSDVEHVLLYYDVHNILCLISTSLSGRDYDQGLSTNMHEISTQLFQSVSPLFVFVYLQTPVPASVPIDEEVCLPDHVGAAYTTCYCCCCCCWWWWWGWWWYSRQMLKAVSSAALVVVLKAQ